MCYWILSVVLELTTFSQHAIALAVLSEECVQAFITSELQVLGPWLPPSASSQVAAPGRTNVSSYVTRPGRRLIER